MNPLLFDPFPWLLDDEEDVEDDCQFHDWVLFCPAPAPVPPKLRLLFASVLDLEVTPKLAGPHMLSTDPWNPPCLGWQCPMVR